MNQSEAAHWFQKAAKQGQVDAQFSNAICHANGQGVGQDYQEAVNWFRLAAQQGHAGAQVSLGLCLQKGLGRCLANGQGTPMDAIEGYKLLTLAARRATPGAADAREELMSRMSSEEIAQGDKCAALASPKSVRSAAPTRLDDEHSAVLLQTDSVDGGGTA